MYSHWYLDRSRRKICTRSTGVDRCIFVGCLLGVSLLGPVGGVDVAILGVHGVVGGGVPRISGRVDVDVGVVPVERHHQGEGHREEG